MKTRKISSALAKQTDTSKSVFLLDENVKSKTVEQTFIEKLPQSAPIDDENYNTPVSNETFPFRLSIFDLINGQHIRKAAISTDLMDHLALIQMNGDVF